MKKPTFRILKTIGIVAFVLLFGVFIYLYYRAQFAVSGMSVVRVTSGSDNGEVAPLRYETPIGFDYTGRS